MLATNNGQREILGSHGGATEDSNPLILYAAPLGKKITDVSKIRSSSICKINRSKK
jgi:hypothetical protein